MITRCAGFVTDHCISQNAIQPEERELYQYGFELIISTAVNFFWVIAVGLFFRNVLGAVVSFIVFARIRTQSGGYHAKTYFRCNLSLIAVYICIMAAVQFLHTQQVPIVYFLPFYIGVTVFIYHFSPITREDEPLEDSKRIGTKRKVLKRIILWETIGVCDWLFGSGKLAVLIIVTLLSIAVLMAVAMVKEVRL